MKAVAYLGIVFGAMALISACANNTLLEWVLYFLLGFGTGALLAMMFNSFTEDK